MSLKTKLEDLTAAIAAKTNELHTLAELKANKKQDLTSESSNDYPSVPAVNEGLAVTLQDAKDYVNSEMSDVVTDANYVHTDNNYTDAEKTKLAGMEGTKFRGQFLNLSALEAANPNPEAGEYADVDGGAGQDVIRYVYDSSDDGWVAQQGESAMMTSAQVKSAYEANPDTNAFSDSAVTDLANAKAHSSTTNNPHGVTKAQVGLSNVNNTSDLNKPVSTAQAAAIALVQDDLDDYKVEIGEAFPDYVSQFNTEINY